MLGACLVHLVESRVVLVRPNEFIIELEALLEFVFVLAAHGAEIPLESLHVGAPVHEVLSLALSRQQSLIRPHWLLLLAPVMHIVFAAARHATPRAPLIFPSRCFFELILDL